MSDSDIQGWRYFMGQSFCVFILKFALPPFSPPLSPMVQIFKIKRAQPLTTEITGRLYKRQSFDNKILR